MLALALPHARECSGFCFEEAGKRYDVPAGLLWAIAKVESNFDPLAVNRNANGTYDIGVMQINSTWARQIGPRAWKELEKDACANVNFGARVLADCISRYGYGWEAIGCYNAVSPERRVEYARRVIAVIDTMER
jgi:soluble lytic murein transglycosylase-like protein